jgi:type II secretory pathway component PulF
MAAVLLDAIADCHDDQSRGRLSLGQWLIGPVLIAVVGLIVGLVALALFMLLIKLVIDLS